MSTFFSSFLAKERTSNVRKAKQFPMISFERKEEKLFHADALRSSSNSTVSHNAYSIHGCYVLLCIDMYYMHGNTKCLHKHQNTIIHRCSYSIYITCILKERHMALWW